MPVNSCDSLVAETALWSVDDPLERKVVGGLNDETEIGDCVPDLRALVKAEAPDDLVGKANRNEALFKLARLELSAHKNGNIVERATRTRARLGFFADPPSLLRPVPNANHADLLAFARIGPQRLAEPI